MRRRARLYGMVLLLWGWLAQAATLTWEASTTNTDGTPLLDLYSYRLYYRPTATAPWALFHEVPGLVTTVVLAVQEGEYTVRAVNAAGLESGSATPLAIRKPLPPGLLGVQPSP